MEDLLGGTLASFLGLSLVLFGAASWMMGEALATTWRSPRQTLPYAGLLAATERFLDFALFDGQLGSLTGLVACWLILSALSQAGFRFRRATQLAAQYPWIFERSGLFSVRLRG
jgi:hypothetical protein